MVTAGVETMVRMGELGVSRTAGDLLVALGLGSCVGLALVDGARGIAGLAHIVLPASKESRDGASSAKFADVAVPRLVELLAGLGARRGSLAAVLVGGAQMFTAGGSGLDIGRRNEEATREQLAELGIPVLAAETGGSKGRTLRVHVHGKVTVKEAGGVEQELHDATPELVW
jgi:chemotaxis protein CheD